MPPAWLGRSKCKKGVTGEVLPGCPVIPSHLGQFVEGVGWPVTKYKCKECGAELEKAFAVEPRKTG